MATAKKTAPAAKTAAPKVAAKAAPAKKPGTALVAWEEEMRARAQKTAKAETVTGGFKKLSTAGGILKVDDEAIEGNELRVVIIGYVHENQYYDKPYDPRNPTVPVCYAFSEPDSETPEDDMAPHEEAEDKQGDEEGKCAGCWANKMGSADVGRGKACKNIRRLAVVTEDALESGQALIDAEVRMLNVPVMSVRNWAKFANHINDDMGRPPEAVVCMVGVEPDPKSQFQVTFRFEELINFDQELWDAMNKKRAEVNKALIEAYPKQADLDAANAPQQKVQVRGKMAANMAKKAPAKPAAKAAKSKF